MKKKISIIILVLFLLSMATLILTASSLDSCHKKCGSLYPDSKAKYDACFVGCMVK